MAHRNCNGAVVVVTCPEPCPEAQTISLSNINLAGVGVLDSFASGVGAFRGVEAGNSMVTVTLNNTNHTIVITPQAAAIAAALPAATTTQVGVLETATDGEALAKSATDKIVTPSNFAAMGSSTSFAGLIEIATLPEVEAGVSTTLAVVPSTLAGRNFLSLTTGATTLPNAAASTVDFGTGSSLEFSGTNGETFVLNGLTLRIDGGGQLVLQNGTTLDFIPGSVIEINGTPVPDDSLLGTGTGVVGSYPITAFASSFNTQSGYIAMPNALVLRTADVNTVTLPQLASIVNTLISDLKLVLLPVN